MANWFTSAGESMVKRSGLSLDDVHPLTARDLELIVRALGLVVLIHESLENRLVAGDLLFLRSRERDLERFGPALAIRIRDACSRDRGQRDS